MAQMNADKNSVNIIKARLVKLKEVVDLNEFDIDFPSKKIDVGKYDLQEAKLLREIYSDISNLSIGALNNFEFFKQLFVQDKHNSPVYNTAMQNIGYQRCNNQWKLVKQPNIDIVAKNVYNYCFYNFVVGSRTNTLKPARKPEEKLDAVINITKVTMINVEKLGPDPLGAVVDKWTCNKCSLLSSFDDVFCSVCHNSGPHLDKWRCSKCTFINEKESKKCGSCQMPNNTVIEVLNLETVAIERR